MAKVITTKNKNFINNANIKLKGLSGTSWLNFFDAVGRVEGGNQYDISNGLGYYGIYQQGCGGHLGIGGQSPRCFVI